ncbi:VOC family protein [uncultured Sneathiella sp.]|uniref:VOC family protein n=1 Tax=uncultured Sneathiella sp. TaxID=879315 RepID=UPI0030ECF8F2|tara:strand:- start:133275 stop:133646 length:372 start_codon:yes stop_codon:yes gene_type:complete
MIGYVTLGTNDIDKATEFYDELLAEIGAKRVLSNDRLRMWSVARGQPMLAVIKPYDQKEATIGNGTMVAILLENAEMVGKMHAKALSMGCEDEGPLGPRGSGQSVFAYCRDLEGHKLAFYAPA